MGLVTKELEVCISSCNQKYYEDLGYYIPKEVNKNGKEIVKSGTYIKVKTDDLPKNSHYKVDVLCDCCGDKFTGRYSQYWENTNRNNGKYICSSTKALNDGSTDEFEGVSKIKDSDVYFNQLIDCFEQSS